MKNNLNENLYNFCMELNNVRFINVKFSAIILDNNRIELYFTERAFTNIYNENSRAGRKFEKLLNKYSLESDLIRYKCIEVREKNQIKNIF